VTGQGHCATLDCERLRLARQDELHIRFEPRECMRQGRAEWRALRLCNIQQVMSRHLEMDQLVRGSPIVKFLKMLGRLTALRIG